MILIWDRFFNERQDRDRLLKTRHGVSSNSDLETWSCMYLPISQIDKKKHTHTIKSILFDNWVVRKYLLLYKSYKPEPESKPSVSLYNLVEPEPES